MIAQALIGLGLLGIMPSDYGYDEPNRNRILANVQNIRSLIPANGYLQHTGPQERTTKRVNIPIFVPNDFPFVTLIPDDGTGPAGGWQVAKVSLNFYRIDIVLPGVIRWKCPITIGMPIRHWSKGYISPSSAASKSALVANAVTIAMDFDLPQGVFCHKFFLGVEAAFPTIFPGLGATVAK